MIEDTPGDSNSMTLKELAVLNIEDPLIAEILEVYDHIWNSELNI